jgi:hypothetical protein
MEIVRSTKRNRLYVRLTNEERFWPFAQKSESGCWEWQGSRNRGGYGAKGLHSSIEKPRESGSTFLPGETSRCPRLSGTGMS